MLRGFYQYFGLHHCEGKLSWVRRTSAVFTTISMSHLASEPNPKLIFHRYGDDYFLAEMWWGGRSDGRKLLPSKAERELAQEVRPVRIVSVAVR